MPSQNARRHAHQQRTDEQHSTETSPQQPSPLLAQAAPFLAIARQRYQECERGEDAEKELAKRRNESGQ